VTHPAGAEVWACAVSVEDVRGHGAVSMHRVSEMVRAVGDDGFASARVRQGLPAPAPNKLARPRRRSERGERRAEEAARQRAHRQAKRCPTPHSDDKCRDLLLKLEQIVDDGARLSRATFRREARRILRENGLFGAANIDGAGRCHTPPSVLGPAGNWLRIRRPRGRCHAPVWFVMAGRDGLATCCPPPMPTIS
jgi:hypothetical protein